MKTSQFMPGAFAAITGSFCLRHCNAMNVSGRNGLPWCSNLLCKNLLTFPVFNYQLALCWVYTGACCGLFMWAITSLDFNEWTRSNSLEPPHERKQTEQRGNVENIPDCACMHALFLSQAALFVLMFILGEQTTASSEAGSDGENRQFFAITSHGSWWIKTWDEANIQPWACVHRVGCDEKCSIRALLPEEFTYRVHGNCGSPCPRLCCISSTLPF